MASYGIYSHLGEREDPGDDITSIDKLATSFSLFNPRVELVEASEIPDVNPRERFEPSPDAIHYATCRAFDRELRRAFGLDPVLQQERLLEILRLLRYARKTAKMQIPLASKEARAKQTTEWLEKYRGRFEEILARINKGRDKLTAEEITAVDAASRMIP